MKKEIKSFVDRLRSLARTQNRQVVRDELANERPEDIAEGLQRVGFDEGLAILTNVNDVTAAYVLVELPTGTARQYLNALPDATLAHYIDILPMDDALDLREELGPERFDSLLHVIPHEDALEIQRLLGYPEQSAGRLMTEDFFEARPEETTAEIIQTIRDAEPGRYETVNDIYVLTEDRHVVGVFSLRQAIQAQPHVTAREIMNADVISASAFDSAEDVARQIARYGFYAMPVLDQRARMVGIFTVDDAQSILSAADTEDVLKLGGVSGDAESYLSLGTWAIVRRRLPWLFVLFLAETLTGAVLRYYIGSDASSSPGTNHRLQLIAQLSLFIPLLLGAGGNTGSQVTTTITRALAVGEVRTSDYATVLRKEFGVALLIGLCLGLVGFLRSHFGWGSPLSISIVVGMALPTIVIWATTVGSVLPLAAKRLGIDPAVMSAPFIATFVDATGLVIYFEIAQRVLNTHFAS